MQIDDKVVSYITRELLKRLGQDFGEKVPLAVIGGALSNTALTAVEAGYAVSVRDGLEPDFSDDTVVLVTKLSIQALVRVAEGDPGCTAEGHALLWAMLRGKKAFVLEESIEWRSFSAQMPRALFAQYTACEQKLAGYGIKIIREADIGTALSGKAAPQAAPAPVQSVSPVSINTISPGRKQVITELELSQMCPASKGKGQTLVIGSADILTPLARDYITAMAITVTKST